MKENSTSRLFALMLPAALLWSGAFIAAKFTVNQVPLFTATFLRFLFAIIPMLILGLATKTVSLPQKQIVPLLMLLVFTGIFGYHLMFFLSLRYTSATNASMIVALIPLMTVFFARLILKNSFAFSQLLCFLLSLSGAFLVVTKGNVAHFFSGGANIGDMIILAAAVMFALYSVLSRKAAGKIEPVNLMLWLYAISCALLLPGVLIERPLAAIMKMDWIGWLSFAYMGAFSSGIGYWLQQISIKEFGPSRTMIFNNLVPIFSIFLAALLLGERPVWLDFAALALIIAGLFLNAYISARREKANA